ncbi:hypothetical protein GW17_00011039 [Ensete ventricosum]|nr:hypothetical protein GW17_00011039 [Ensete ventricosum]
MGNCTVKGTMVSCSVKGATVSFTVSETTKEVKLEAAGRFKDMIAYAEPPATRKASGSAGRPRNYQGTETFKNLEVLPSLEKGIWRVRLAISSEQLAEILSEQANTGAMIERMRTYASTAEAAQKQPKCKRAADWMSQHCEDVFAC